MALTAPLDPDAPRDLQAAAVYVAAMFPEDASTLTPRIRAVGDAAGDPRLERGADLALALLGERAMPEALTVASTDERGRPEAVSFEEDEERVDQLASSKLHDAVFGDE